MEIDKDQLNAACSAVIDALKPWPPEYKIAALHVLIDSFPAGYVIADKLK